MDGASLSLTAIISTFVSGGISYFFYSWQKKTDHEYDYRKYILEKRKKVYDETEIILSNITFTKYVVPPGRFIVSGKTLEVPAFVDKGNVDEMDEFNNRVAVLMGQGFWLSDKMFIAARELNIILVELIDKCEKSKDTPLNTINSFMDRFKALGKEMSDIYFEDICTLNNIRKFKAKQEYY
jgi:hypothetical protein